MWQCHGDWIWWISKIITELIFFTYFCQDPSVIYEQIILFFVWKWKLWPMNSNSCLRSTFRAEQLWLHFYEWNKRRIQWPWTEQERTRSYWRLSNLRHWHVFNDRCLTCSTAVDSSRSHVFGGGLYERFVFFYSGCSLWTVKVLIVAECVEQSSGSSHHLEEPETWCQARSVWSISIYDWTLLWPLYDSDWKRIENGGSLRLVHQNWEASQRPNSSSASAVTSQSRGKATNGKRLCVARDQQGRNFRCWVLAILTSIKKHRLIKINPQFMNMKIRIKLWWLYRHGYHWISYRSSFELDPMNLT